MRYIVMYLRPFYNYYFLIPEKCILSAIFTTYLYLKKKKMFPQISCIIMIIMIIIKFIPLNITPQVMNWLVLNWKEVYLWQTFQQHKKC